MDKKKEAKLNMYRAVEAQCDANPTVVSEVTALADAVSRFKTKIAAIVGTTQQKVTVITGITTDKSVSKRSLAEKTSIVADAVYAYAAKNADNELKAEMKISVNQLMKTRDDALAPRCQNVHDKANAIITDLQDYGITAAKLADLQTAIDDYFASTVKPRTATSHRKALNARLNDQFKETDEILLNEMDKLVNTLKPAHPDFVREYESNREVIDPPSRPRPPKPAAEKKDDGTPE